MRIMSIREEPVHEIQFRVAASGGGAVDARLPVLLGTVDHLPDQLDALIATADLQGRGQSSQQLLGEVVASELEALAELGCLPLEPRATGILLAGDLWSSPELDRRGGQGDVRDVWRAFSSRFRWVAGVAGNHDTFGDDVEEHERFAREPGMHLLDGDLVGLDGLRVCGVGGIIGNSRKNFRKTQDDFVALTTKVLAQRPDLLLFHEGPEGPSPLRGHPAIRDAVKDARGTLIVRGHVYWATPLAVIENDIQVLNVDGRVVVLCRAG